MPERKKSGTNTSITIKVANRIAPRISLDASMITFEAGSRSSSLRAAFSRRRRNTFSTSMMASSTNAPMAMVRPPKVMVLIVTPAASITIAAPTSESGNAVSDISVVRKFHRNRSRMRATRIAPSRSATPTLSTATSMKSAWRKSSRFELDAVG